MNNNDCAIKGVYPKSFIKSDLAKFIHDHLLDVSGNCSRVNRIRNFYDLIFTLQIEIENNQVSDYNKKMISSFNSVDNLLAYYFTNIRKLMSEVRARDDYIISNDEIYRVALKCIKHHIKTHNITF
jgi:hypothetical protein